MMHITAASPAETKLNVLPGGAPPLEPGKVLSEMNALFREDNSLSAYLERVIKMREAQEQLEACLSDAKRATAQTEVDLITAMTEQGLETFRIAGMTVMRREEVYPRVLQENKDAQMDWLQEIGHADAIKPTVHPQTFGAIVRELIAAKAEIPEFVRIHKEWKLYIRRGVAR